MTGIYIHIPFCVKKCNYCDFPSFGLRDGRADAFAIEKYVSFLKEEISHDAMLKDGEDINTVFFGGGTPSLLKPEQLDDILCKLNSRFNILKDAEITMEMNPGTLPENGLHNIRKAGVNRISMGVQSLDDGELKTLGRIHDAKGAAEAYRQLRKAGFDNVNIDLMCAVPGQTMQSLEVTCKELIKMEPEHVSLYTLILEEGTPFFEKYKAGRLKLPDEDDAADMFDAAAKMLEGSGYGRYEISNFAKEGYECRHNTGCWERKPYRGYGMMASSLIGDVRFTAEKTLEEYYKGCTLSFDKRSHATEYRELSIKEKMEEFMFLGLRMAKGVSKFDFLHNFNCDISTIYGKIIDKYVNIGLLRIKAENDDERIAFTARGIEVANPIMAEFLL